MNFKSRFWIVPVAAAVIVAFCQTSVSAQIASALIREGDTLPGEPTGAAITAINNSAQNGVGGYAFTVNTGTVGHIWGNATGGAGGILISEGTVGNLEQTAFESFFGLSDAGMVGYSTLSTDLISGTTGLDGAWVGTTVLLNELDPITALPGNFSTFNSRVGMTQSGTPYWVGGYTDMLGGSTQDRALFLGNSPAAILRGGDSITGITETVLPNQGIDFDVRFSANGSNYINPTGVNSGSTLNDVVMVSNGAVMMAGGSIIREGSPVPISVGGLVGENYDNFDFLGITESGNYLITGDTDFATTTRDEFVMTNSRIVLREGDSIDGFVLNGAIEGGYMNEDGDWAVIWDVDTMTGANLEALIFNGQIVLLEGDLVDWNGDGVIDAADQGGFLTNFTGISSLTLGDRDASGFVNLAFTADVDLGEGILEGGFSLSVFAVPEPGTATLLGLMAVVPLLHRRRRRPV